MSRDHDFETIMREAHAGMGQIGLSRVARKEHDKVLEMERLLANIREWMEPQELDNYGVRLLSLINKRLDIRKDTHGED